MSLDNKGNRCKSVKASEKQEEMVEAAFQNQPSLWNPTKGERGFSEGLQEEYKAAFVHSEKNKLKMNNNEYVTRPLSMFWIIDDYHET